jgi:hypothetical protein
LAICFKISSPFSLSPVSPFSSVPSPHSPLLSSLLTQWIYAKLHFLLFSMTGLIFSLILWGMENHNTGLSFVNAVCILAFYFIFSCVNHYNIITITTYEFTTTITIILYTLTGCYFFFLFQYVISFGCMTGAGLAPVDFSKFMTITQVLGLINEKW